MYKELFIKFKSGNYDSYSPLEEMKLSKYDDSIEINWYGTVSVHKDIIQLNEIDKIIIKNVIDENYEVVEERVVYDDRIDIIKEFDNLNNSTYGILRNIK